MINKNVLLLYFIQMFQKNVCVGFANCILLIKCIDFWFPSISYWFALLEFHFRLESVHFDKDFNVSLAPTLASMSFYSIQILFMLQVCDMFFSVGKIWIESNMDCFRLIFKIYFFFLFSFFFFDFSVHFFSNNDKNKDNQEA